MTTVNKHQQFREDSGKTPTQLEGELGNVLGRDIETLCGINTTLCGDAKEAVQIARTLRLAPRLFYILTEQARVCVSEFMFQVLPVPEFRGALRALFALDENTVDEFLSAADEKGREIPATKREVTIAKEGNIIYVLIIEKRRVHVIIVSAS